MKKFLPQIYVKDVYHIPYKKLKENKITHLLFDLDNTIVPIHEKDPGEKFKKLLTELKQLGFSVFVFSNNPYNRIETFGKENDLSVITSARKPWKGKYKKFLKEQNISANQCAMIGDQLLTDIFGGNRMGMMTILVDPLAEKDLWITKWNRKIEKRIKKKYKKLVEGDYFE